MADDDLEPGWAGLSILLWPAMKFMQIKSWFHKKLHPEDPVEWDDR